MSGIDQVFLGTAVAHDHFRIALSVLLNLVSNASRSVGIAEMQEQTNYPRKNLVRICEALEAAEIAKRDPRARDAWMLSCMPSRVTLEDVFCCATAQLATARQKENEMAAAAGNGFHRNVELIMSQAAMSTNQIVRKNLRSFHLDRLASMQV